MSLNSKVQYVTKTPILGVIFDQESEEEVDGPENLVTPEQVVHMSDQWTRQRGVYKIATYMKVLMLMRHMCCGRES
jgi:hypothetical protein